MNSGLFSKKLNERQAAALYVLVIVGSLMTSSVRHTQKISLAIGTSLIVSVKIWLAAFASTWCFFSACISSGVYLVTREELQYRQQCMMDKDQRMNDIVLDEGKAK